MASDREITLGDVGRTIWRGKWYIVLAAVLGGLIGLLLTFTGGTKYTASSQVYLGQATTMMGNLAQTAGTNPLTAATILQGDAIVDEVAAKTGLTRGQVNSDTDISVSRAPGTTNRSTPRRPPAHPRTRPSRALRSTVRLVVSGAFAALRAVRPPRPEGDQLRSLIVLLRSTPLPVLSRRFR